MAKKSDSNKTVTWLDIKRDLYLIFACYRQYTDGLNNPVSTKAPVTDFVSTIDQAIGSLPIEFQRQIIRLRYLESDHYLDSEVWELLKTKGYAVSFTTFNRHKKGALLQLASSIKSLIPAIKNAENNAVRQTLEKASTSHVSRKLNRTKRMLRAERGTSHGT